MKKLYGVLCNEPVKLEPSSSLYNIKRVELELKLFEF